jgi:hypothetical protein
MKSINHHHTVLYTIVKTFPIFFCLKFFSLRTWRFKTACDLWMVAFSVLQLGDNPAANFAIQFL